MQSLISVNLITVNKQPVDGDHVDEFVELLESGRKLPPIVVREVEGGYVLVDGRHRLKAHKILGREMIWARKTL